MTTDRNTPAGNGVSFRRMKTHQLDGQRRTDLDEVERQAVMANVLRDEELIAQIDEDHDADWTRPRFPERLFRDNFLPVLTGDAYKRLPPGKTEEQLTDEARLMWLNVSKGPLNEVDVVTEDGKVAFTMPALLPTRHLDSMQQREGPMDRRMRPMKVYAEEYRQHQQTLPAVGNARLQAGLNHKLHVMFARGDNGEVRNKINKMYEYYGIAPEKADGSKPAQAKQGDSPFSGDDMGEMSFD